MTKYIKEYKISFSLNGLIAFLLIMLPNIFWMINPPDNNFLSTNSSSIAVINIIMTVSQIAMIALLILLVKKSDKTPKSRIYKLLCLFCVVIYYISWVLYYFNIVSPIMFIGMAVFPCCYFISFILWQKTYLTLIPATVFSILHIGITIFNVL